MWRLSFQLTVTNGTQPKAKHVAVGFLFSLKKFFFRFFSENFYGRANDDTANRSSTHCHSHNFQLFSFYDSRASKTWSLSLATQQIKFQSILPFAVWFLSWKTFSHSCRIAFIIRAGNISIERRIHFILFHLFLLQYSRYYTLYTIQRVHE